MLSLRVSKQYVHLFEKENKILTAPNLSMALMCCLKSVWNNCVRMPLLKPAASIWVLSCSTNSPRGCVKLHLNTWRINSKCILTWLSPITFKNNLISRFHIKAYSKLIEGPTTISSQLNANGPLHGKNSNLDFYTFIELHRFYSLIM